MSSEQTQLSPEQAQIEAQLIQDIAGNQATPETYAAAHSQLIEQQMKEILEGKDFLEILEAATDQIDSLRRDHNQISKVTSHLRAKTTLLENSSNRLQRLESDQTLLLETKEKNAITGNHTLPVALYGDTLFFGLSEAAKDVTQRETMHSILDKLSQANSSNKENTDQIQAIPLTETELEFLKEAIPAALQDTTAAIARLRTTIAECTQNISADENQLSLLNEQDLELSDKYRATISVLDAFEIENGAPPYPDSSEPAVNQYQSYLQRIKWRKQYLASQLSREMPPRGNAELGYKWALFAVIDTQYFLLNKETTYSSTYPLDIIQHRTPGQTYALYSESVTEGRDLSIRAVITNGAIQTSSFETIETEQAKLKAQSRELKQQMR